MNRHIRASRPPQLLMSATPLLHASRCPLFPSQRIAFQNAVTTRYTTLHHQCITTANLLPRAMFPSARSSATAKSVKTTSNALHLDASTRRFAALGNSGDTTRQHTRLWEGSPGSGVQWKGVRGVEREERRSQGRTRCTIIWGGCMQVSLGLERRGVVAVDLHINIRMQISHAWVLEFENTSFEYAFES
jgi:hypothetical protein